MTAAVWKVVADSAAAEHLLVDLERFTLDRKPPLALLPPDAAPILPSPLPDMLLPEPARDVATVSSEPARLVLGPTFDASRLPEPQREQFHRKMTLEELERCFYQASLTIINKPSTACDRC